MFRLQIIISWCVVVSLLVASCTAISGSSFYEEIPANRLGKREVLDVLDSVTRLTCLQKCKVDQDCVNSVFQAQTDPSDQSTSSVGECFLLSWPTGSGIHFNATRMKITRSDMRVYTTVPAQKFVYRNCTEAYSAGRRKNGIYYLRNLGWQFCGLEELSRCGAGGWTLAMLADGSQHLHFMREFLYDSDLWKKIDVLNPFPVTHDPLVAPAKYHTFNSMPLTCICLGMNVQGVVNYVKIPVKASSLLELFKSNDYIQTNVGVKEWESLIPNPQIQTMCDNIQGINLKNGVTNLRIGILRNDEGCSVDFFDSWIGVGKSKPLWCNGKKSAADDFSAGNEACIPKETLAPALVYIFIQ